MNARILLLRVLAGIQGLIGLGDLMEFVLRQLPFQFLYAAVDLASMCVLWHLSDKLPVVPTDEQLRGRHERTHW
jgi:hypothetical protein